MGSPQHQDGKAGAAPHAAPTLREEVASATGANPARCYQCGKCSAGCPMAVETRLRPHDIMRLINLDKRDALMENESIWLCLTCEMCAARCPNLCDPARVIDSLRELSLAGGSRAAPRVIRAFHEAFLNQIQSGGRLFELGLIAAYKLSGGPLFQDVLTAPGMFARGKLALTPRRIKGIADVRRIFKACAAAAKESP